MDELSHSEIDSGTTFGARVYDSKLMREKRSSMGLGENADPARKRVKLRDLKSIIPSQDVGNQFDDCEEELSQVTMAQVAANADDVVLEESITKNTLPLFDLNTKFDSSKLVMPGNDERKKEVGCVNLQNIDLNLSVDDVSSSVSNDTFHHSENHDHLKSKDNSECGSSTGPMGEKGSSKVWEEMKQNRFLSSSHGGIPKPKQSGRKRNNDVMMKKMEIAKKEQVDKFMKTAAPTGLLNKLNPGIITNVRNMKQVHSIIEGLVRSERRENALAGTKQASQSESGITEISDKQNDQKNTDNFGLRPTFTQENVFHNILTSGSRQLNMQINKSKSLSSKNVSGDADSTTKISEKPSSISTEENLSSSSLSGKAATVASEWLELLHQDIKGRLGALRRSKKRVHAVIHTELPFLLLKEFSSNQNNDLFATQSSADRCSEIAIADMHQVRWSILFDRMDKTLSEEEEELERWLKQVKEMQLQCDKGLQHKFNMSSGSVTADKAKSELAVNAAAASIYSTCDFLMSKENVPCF